MYDRGSSFDRSQSGSPRLRPAMPATSTGLVPAVPYNPKELEGLKFGLNRSTARLAPPPVKLLLGFELFEAAHLGLPDVLPSLLGLAQSVHAVDWQRVLQHHDKQQQQQQATTYGAAPAAQTAAVVVEVRGALVTPPPPGATLPEPLHFHIYCSSSKLVDLVLRAMTPPLTQLRRKWATAAAAASAVTAQTTLKLAAGAECADVAVALCDHSAFASHAAAAAAAAVNEARYAVDTALTASERLAMTPLKVVVSRNDNADTNANGSTSVDTDSAKTDANTVASTETALAAYEDDYAAFEALLNTTVSDTAAETEAGSNN